MSSGLFATGWVRHRSKLQSQLRFLPRRRMWRGRKSPWQKQSTREVEVWGDVISASPVSSAKHHARSIINPESNHPSSR